MKTLTQKQVDKIIGHEQTCHDTGNVVDVEFDDGSHVHFEWADIVIPPGDPDILMLVTEHHGAFELAREEIRSYTVWTMKQFEYERGRGRKVMAQWVNPEN